MKKLKCMLLVVLGVFTCIILIGCSGTSSAGNAGTNSSSGYDSTTQAETAPDNTSQEEFAVTIDSAEVANSYADERAILVTMTFTNNSENATSFSPTIQDKAFQNGVQLEFTVVSDTDDNSYKEIKPGATITVQRAYILEDDSTVTVELSEWLSFSGKILATKDFEVK
jgi:hypothetical protein